MVVDTTIADPGTPGASKQPPTEALVLAVDDVQDNLDVLEALITRPGVRVLKARDGEQALELLLQHDVAVALLDVQMPNMDGFELAELMRGAHRTRHVPIIFLTAGTPDFGRVFRGYEAGAVDFLFKPLEGHLLQSKVNVFVELFGQRELLAREVEQHRQLVRTAELMIGVLGHDLRNPLNAIATAGEMMRVAADGNARVEKLAATIRRSSARMSRMVTQLLDFANARLGSLPVRRQPTNLRDLCEAAIAEFKESEATFVLDVSGDPTGMWDPDRVLQLFSNLLGNAVQHGIAGEPITVAVHADESESVHVHITNAGALPDDVRDSLFTPFSRSSDPSGGTGLGLFIVDQIVRGHGGDVCADSRGGQTKFTVRLPRHVPSR
jgi:two-component system, sensor histidine kinase and response regulator